MQLKFEESQATSQSIQKTLAKLVTDKQRIEQELAEVTAVSEEMVSMLESRRAI